MRRLVHRAGGTALCIALTLIAACVEPGSIADPDGIISRIQNNGDGGPVGSDGGNGPLPVPGVDAASPPAADPCETVLEDYLVPTCGSVACHGSSAPSALDLESPMHASRLVGMAATVVCDGEVYIDPDTPEDSLLLTKLENPAPCGTTMPYGQPPATAAEKACILSWIEGLIAEGAPASSPDAGMSMPDAGPMDAGPDCAMRDSDDDGTNDCDDLCADDPDKTAPGLCGCGMGDVDTDGDSILDCSDGCPNDPDKNTAGNCGCGAPEQNPCVDGCPNDPNKNAPGNCGCGMPELDPCVDGCPADDTKREPGQCGCGIADTDDDNDNTANCNDACPADPDKTAVGGCGCGMADTDTDRDGTPDCNDGCPAHGGATVAPCNGAGLLVGTLGDAFETTGANNGSEGIDALGPTHSEVLDLPENTTYVLSGEVYVPASGVLSFYENFDDSVLLTVDGQQILNDGTWDNPTAGTFTAAEGWYSFELRLGNGVSASGPAAGVGIGFGYATTDTSGATDAAMYTLPRNTDTTNPDLFRVP